jgi:glycosyltransferase involved in cell wall biosynthesis
LKAQPIKSVKPRVAFVLAGTATGGAEKYLLRVISEFKEDFTPVLLVRGSSPGDLHNAFIELGTEVYYIKFGYFDLLGFLKMVSRLRRLQIDSIVDFTGIFAGPMLLAGRFANVSRRVAFHRRSSFGFKVTWSRLIYAKLSCFLTERSATSIASNSRAALEFFHPKISGNASHTTVVRNFFSVEELLPARSKKAVRQELRIPETAFVILHTGRVDPAKDHKTLVTSVSHVIKQFDNVYCVLAGPGTETLTDLIRCTGAREDQFRLLGNRKDVPDLLRAADLFVFPSVTEGQPNSLLEAILSGLPVIATDIAPIREIIPEQNHDHLVPARDPVALSQEIIRCIDFESVRNLRIYAAEIREQFSREKIRKELMDLFLSVEAKPG